MFTHEIVGYKWVYIIIVGYKHNYSGVCYYEAEILTDTLKNVRILSWKHDYVSRL